MRLTKLIPGPLIIILVLSLAQQAASQELQSGPKDQECATLENLLTFRQWLSCRVEAVVALHINQKGINKQVEIPSIADNTTSLVDQTQAPDLMGLGLNLAGLNTGKDSDDSSLSVTTSAFALYAAATKHDPLDPAFYLRNSGLRRFSFTLGQDAPDSKSTSETDRAFLFGFKYLIINKRDASFQSNRDELKKVSAALAIATVAANNLQSAVEDYIFNQLGDSLGYPQANETENDAKLRFILERLNTAAQTKATLRSLTPEQLEEIRELISENVAAEVARREVSMEVFETIRRRPQLSFSFQTKQREEDGVDEYRSGLLFDFGLYQRLNLAANATFDYEDSKILGGDKRGGRVALEGYLHLNQPNIFDGKDPILLSFAGESKWMSNEKPIYTGQVKLTLPIFDGVELPISFSVANRSELIKESKVKGRFGFTFDLAKLLKGMR